MIYRDKAERSLERRGSIKAWKGERRWGVGIFPDRGDERGISYFEVSNAKGLTGNRIAKGGEK